MYLTGMTVNTERTSVGAGRDAAFKAASQHLITTARHAAGDLTGPAREGFLEGFRAWERASEAEQGVARGVEHWLRRALAERGVLIGGRLRLEQTGDFAVLDATGAVWAEAWPADGGWRWQVAKGDGSVPDYETGEGIGPMVDVLVLEWQGEVARLRAEAREAAEWDTLDVEQIIDRVESLVSGEAQ